MTLILKIATQFSYDTLAPDHSTKSGYKRASGSEGIFQIKPGHTVTSFQYNTLDALCVIKSIIIILGATVPTVSRSSNLSNLTSGSAVLCCGSSSMHVLEAAVYLKGSHGQCFGCY